MCKLRIVTTQQMRMSVIYQLLPLAHELILEAIGNKEKAFSTNMETLLNSLSLEITFRENNL